MPAGSIVGALISSFIADKYSRKVAIMFASILWIIGSILQAAANGIPLLITGRVISGICVGIASTVVPIYQAEIAPKEIRGRVVSLQQWAITWGILIQYFIQYGASFSGGGPDNPVQGAAAFRIPWGIQIVPAAILFVGLFFFPSSPRWLASKDRWDEAIRVLAKLHGKGDLNSPKVLAQYQEIEEALRFERDDAMTSFAALTEPRMARRVILGGVNVMMYYVVYVMQAAGIGDPLLAASIQYILNVVLTLPAILFLDKWGRRPSLLLGSLAMMVLLLTVGALEGAYGEPFHADSGPESAISWIIRGQPKISKAIIACSYLFVGTFAVTWGPTSWTYPSEIFPSQIRAKAVSLSTASNWVWNTALAFAVPPLTLSINWKLYMVFAVFNAMAFVHMFLTAPETKGKTLEEMDDVFDNGVPAWKGVRKWSRLDVLQKEIEEGGLKVSLPLAVFSVQPKQG
ncbi:MAG: hypothetical protein Q9187_005981 [Circinaria calcarea]